MAETAGRRRRRGTPGRRATPDEPRVEAARNDGNWFELALSLMQTPVDLGKSQAERLVGELVKGGQLGQREAERLLGELRGARERAQTRAQSQADRFDRFVETKIEDVLNRVNIPSRSDIERLNNSIEMLTGKVEALVNRGGGGGGHDTPSAPRPSRLDNRGSRS